ncbi:hypothetical protein J7E50_10135 [Pedobacter sp. ISL-68]|uniref:hypothetical protein n=1 Tax=unclassified Pedobacter TaxID=2628915 RepID=UPI001BEAD7FC|nr:MULTISPECIES: hypothetical protein [unclassified Pedobacter]MBT2561189.1 hypothetical protein [Pedobacter sp. ISL-64]MBT2590578.1 hypothetical protein [Pedobacter sp. ISL-68]
MANKSNWKEHLLKSGIPLEFEIKKYLDTKKCVNNFEYTYFRSNEENNLTEFSYDLDSSYIVPPHFVNLMIECKYRHETTKWVFLPEEYGRVDEINFTSFMHKNAHFNTVPSYTPEFPLKFAPLCSKGIELTSDGQNPKTITQAIHQLSYAMAGRIINGMHHQIDDVLRESFGNTIFYDIPIIVTTAKLFRIKEDVAIETIKSANEIEDISSEEPFLVVKTTAGIELETYNKMIFQEFVKEYDKETLKKLLKSFNKDVDFVMSVIAKNYSPTCMIVLHYSKESNGFDDFFKYIDRVFNPDQEIKDLIDKRNNELKELFEKFKKGKKQE